MTAVATTELARARAARIRAGIGAYLATLADIAAAYAQQDWRALGYADWQAYVDGEYSEHRLKLSPEHRQKAVAELRLAGMSQRAIGSALGVDQATVIRDLRRGDADASPEEIKGADGKTYASTRSSPPVSPINVVEASPGPDRSGPEHPCPPERSTEEVDVRHGPDSTPATPGDLAAAASVRAALDIHAPDPHAVHREWRRDFLGQVHAVHVVMRHAPTTVVDRGDDECVRELYRCARLLGEFAQTVADEIARSQPNVVPFRRAQ
ncbi:helix-turn-helix domain-containing protein [Plantactinospora sp. WMMB782]|uniref:helix-turn-helix domain-containing protein n=1 Tax=Plantactinospora sp. WMMB782 TaxID=3404121 RepID=UPI003B956845